jgi:dipeptidyl aminopeptidase/acylaminoacyl peptidase
MNLRLLHRYFLASILIVLALTACGQSIQQPGPLATASTQAVPSSSSTGQATATPVPTTTSTPTARPTRTPTASHSPTPTPFPMSIQAMRAASYPGSDITIEKELASGNGYKRYYASYQSEGLKIYALLTVPDGHAPEGGWPAIVFNHGYIPPEQYRTTERYIAYVDWLARAGYIVFRIDYRGNASSEGNPSGAYGSPGYTVDVLNAVASLKRLPQANPNKIGMWGHSMGGYLTLRAMVISSDIKVGVIWAGVVGSYSDLFYRWHHTGAAPTPDPTRQSWRQAWINQFGTPDENPQFWDSVTSNAYLADLSGPLQLHHSVDDSEVPVAFSEDLAKEIQSVGGTVQLYTYPGDDHNLANSFSLAMTRTIAFFDRYLK